MKLKGKLIMSAAALAACAATLTSTTYAWYTTNTEVKASGVSGVSAESGDASIFISKTSATTGWTTSVTLDANAAAMIPLQLNSTDGKLLKSGDLKVATFGDEGVKGTEYVEFTLYFKTAKTRNNVDLYINTIEVFNITNATADATKTSGYNTGATLPTYENLYSGLTNHPGIGTDAIYSVDMVKALAMTVSNGDIVDGKTAYKLDSFAKKLSETGVLSNGALQGTGAASDAHAYVEGTGVTIDATKKPADDGAIALTANNLKIASLDKDGAASEVTFKLYLNGADKDCFDACKKQSFKFNISFTSAHTTE